MLLEDKRVKEKINFITNIKEKELSLIISDKPKPAKRPRQGKSSFYVPDAAKNKKDIQKFIKEQLPSDFEKIYSDIEIDIKCYVQTLESFSKTDKILAEHGYIRPISKPDADNFAKTYLDALNGFIWDDDGQVIDLRCRKYYSKDPRVEIKIKYKTDFTSSLLKNRKLKRK